MGKARERGQSKTLALLQRFKENPGETRFRVRRELGLIDQLAAEVFAIVVFVCDGLLQVSQSTNAATPAARFVFIASQLPLELQMVLCCRLAGSLKENIRGEDSEAAFMWLAKMI